MSATRCSQAGLRPFARRSDSYARHHGADAGRDRRYTACEPGGAGRPAGRSSRSDRPPGSESASPTRRALAAPWAWQELEHERRSPDDQRRDDPGPEPLDLDVVRDEVGDEEREPRREQGRETDGRRRVLAKDAADDPSRRERDCREQDHRRDEADLVDAEAVEEHGRDEQRDEVRGERKRDAHDHAFHDLIVTPAPAGSVARRATVARPLSGDRRLRHDVLRGADAAASRLRRRFRTSRRPGAGPLQAAYPLGVLVGSIPARLRRGALRRQADGDHRAAPHRRRRPCSSVSPTRSSRSTSPASSRASRAPAPGRPPSRG